MSVIDQIAGQFAEDVRGRGRAYFEEGRAEVVDHDEGGVKLLVCGSQQYDVEIDFTQGCRASCTCAYARDKGPCKHMWAALLEVNSQHLLPHSDDVRVSGDPSDHRDITPLPSSRLHPTANNKPAQLPQWKKQLADLRKAMAAPRETFDRGKSWPQNKRIVYLIDSAHSHSASSPLRLTVATQTTGRAGQWGAIKSARLMHRQIASLPDPQDQQIIRMLVGTKVQTYYYDYAIDPSFELAPIDHELILKPVCQTGRCFFSGASEGSAIKASVPLQWDDGPPWELWVQMAPDETGERYTVDASLRRGDQRIAARQVPMVCADGLAIIGNTITRFQHFGAFPILEYLRRGDHKLSLAVQQADEMLQELLSLPALPRLDLPAEMNLRTVNVPMRPHLRISPPPKKQYVDDKLVGHLSFDYGGKLIAEQEPTNQFDPVERTLIHRDPIAERAATARLDELKFRFEYLYDIKPKRRLVPTQLNRVVLALCSEGWSVEADGRLYRQPGEFKVEVSSGIDWFELNGSIDFGGVSAQLPRLLAALRRGEKTVRLDDGTLGILPEQWLSRYGLLARIDKTDEDEQAIRFSKGQIGLLDALVSNIPEARVDEVFKHARQELLDFHGVEPVEAPADFRGILRPYQRQGLGWLGFLSRFGFGGCLADDMGLGKTIQVLALLESRRQMKLGRPSLVVVPRSLIFNWVEEAKHFTPNLHVLDHSGVTRAKTPESFLNYDVVLTTYGTMRLDAPTLKDFRFDYVVLDEAQAIKNGASESAKAARLIQADHRLALSGTPVQNHLGELWSLFEFLNPGMLGGSSVFKASGAGSAQIEREGRELLARALRPFILRRTKEQVAPDLPAKTEQTIWCDLEPEQRKLYDELRDHYRASLLDRIKTEGINKSKIQVLEALLRLRQAACHPGLLDKAHIDHPSAKLDSLLPQIAEVIQEKHKVLVFSQFTSLLAIVKRHLDKQKISYEYLDGKTKDRQECVNRFQNDPQCRLFLISLKAGGLGLNLTAAEYVFLLDPWWNPAVESQAIDRAHRIGQTRHVFAYRLIARDTVEQKVLELQSKKKDLADMIINADNSLISQLGREDLELLLS